MSFKSIVFWTASLWHGWLEVSEETTSLFNLKFNTSEGWCYFFECPRHLVSESTYPHKAHRLFIFSTMDFLPLGLLRWKQGNKYHLLLPLVTQIKEGPCIYPLSMHIPRAPGIVLWKSCLPWPPSSLQGLEFLQEAFAIPAYQWASTLINWFGSAKCEQMLLRLTMEKDIKGGALFG